MTPGLDVRRVLIIEDSLEDALLLGLAFEDQAPDIQVDAVSDGDSALARCQAPDPPDLVVLDMHILGQTALEILTQLQQQCLVPVQVVCWSSHAHPADVQAVLEQGAATYLEKPREGAGFEQIVQTLLAL